MIALHASHYMPEDHGTHVDFIAPWARAVEQESGGALSMVVHSGALPLGKLENQYAQVAEGTVDIAHSPGHLPQGRFPRTSLIGLPFMVESTAAATRLLWQLFRQGALDAEFSGFHVLALHVDSGALLHTRDGPIRDRRDLAGLRLRSPNPSVSAALAALGAHPVQVAPPDIGKAAEAGRLDGAVMAWDVLAYSGTADIFRHHLDTKLFFAPLYFVMNRARYEALPADARAAIDSVSGTALVEKFPAWWQRWEAPGVAQGQAPGHVVSLLHEAERATWRAAASPAIAERLGQLAAAAPDISAIHARAEALLART